MSMAAKNMLLSTAKSHKNLFWSIYYSGEVFDKLKTKDFNATSLSTYDILVFTLLYLIICLR